MQHIQSALEVRLKDTSSATLQDVLRFCYTAECHLTPDNVLPICALAEHFDVKALHSACVQFIEHNISVSSCCTMLEMAAQYNMEALRKASAVSCLAAAAAVLPSLNCTHSLQAKSFPGVSTAACVCSSLELHKDILPADISGRHVSAQSEQRRSAIFLSAKHNIALYLPTLSIPICCHICNTIYDQAMAPSSFCRCAGIWSWSILMTHASMKALCASGMGPVLLTLSQETHAFQLRNAFQCIAWSMHYSQHLSLY